MDGIRGKLMNNNLKSLFSALNDRLIDFYPIFAKITGSITSGLLLSQIAYLSKAMNYQEFCQTDSDFRDELCMGSYELTNAKKILVDLSVVSIVRKGIPAKSFYKLDREKLN